jgi:hypothetical protein
LSGRVDDGTRAGAEDAIVSVVVADDVESQCGDGRFISRSDSLVGFEDFEAAQGNGGGNGLATGRSVDVGNTGDDVAGVDRDNVDDSAGGDLVGLGQGGNRGLVVDDLGVGAGGNGAGPVVNDTVESLVTGLGEDYVLLPVGSGAWGTRKLLWERISILLYKSKGSEALTGITVELETKTVLGGDQRLGKGDFNVEASDSITSIRKEVVEVAAKAL